MGEPWFLDAESGCPSDLLAYVSINLKAGSEAEAGQVHDISGYLIRSGVLCSTVFLRR